MEPPLANWMKTKFLFAKPLYSKQSCQKCYPRVLWVTSSTPFPMNLSSQNSISLCRQWQPFKLWPRLRVCLSDSKNPPGLSPNLHVKVHGSLSFILIMLPPHSSRNVLSIQLKGIIKRTHRIFTVVFIIWVNKQHGSLRIPEKKIKRLSMRRRRMEIITRAAQPNRSISPAAMAGRF